MATYSYIGYATTALISGFGTFRVDPDFDPATDRVNIEVTDAAGGNTLGGSASRPDLGFAFDGDRFRNELGDDLTQDGVVTALDGTQIDSGEIYLEQGWTLTAAGQPTITLYRVEVEGNFVGYIPSQPLTEGVTYNASGFNVVPSNAPDSRDPNALTDVPCFVAGTLIRTPHGEVPVETLRAGDTVLTADGAPADVVWAGSRAVLPAFLADHGLWPVRIAKGALGPDLPHRDLYVSPNHRLALSGALCEMLCGCTDVLVPAKFLLPLDGVNTCQLDGPVVYCHLLFDTHRILLADGAPSESLHPGDIAMGAFHAEAREEVLTLFPELEEFGIESYGPSAAKVLRRPEARVLIEALRGP